jgi:hypothetical protein
LPAELRREITPKKREADALAALVVACATESLASLSAQARVLADPERLREMDARQLAIMHGTLFDRAWRMLAMVAPVDDEQNP